MDSGLCPVLGTGGPCVNDTYFHKEEGRSLLLVDVNAEGFLDLSNPIDAGNDNHCLLLKRFVDRALCILELLHDKRVEFPPYMNNTKGEGMNKDIARRRHKRDTHLLRSPVG